MSALPEALARRYGRLLAVSCAAFLVLVGARWMLDIDRWQVWRKETSYMARQKDFGYDVVGRFGRMRFPAMIVDRVDGRNGVVFSDSQGQVHEYRGFAGYQLKAVTFRPVHDRDKPFTVVLRRRIA